MKRNYILSHGGAFITKFMIVLVLLHITACKKLVDVSSPPTNITGDNVYKNDGTAVSVLTGIYIQMASNYSLSSGITSISYYPGLSADEFTLYSGITGAPLFYYQNALTNQNLEEIDLWLKIYPLIYVCNTAINGITASGSLTPAVKQQLLGEAKFTRAFCYSYLVQLYGDVPLALGTDYTVNSQLPRTDKALVYKQIILDLQEAQTALSAGYIDASLLKASGERVRPTKGAATALLARVYLLTGDYAAAATQASAVIGNALYGLSPLAGSSSVFMKNSSEAIWQLQPVLSGQNTPDGQLFIIPAGGPSPGYPVYLSKNLLAEFEPNDLRKTNWTNSVTVGGITYSYPYKYKSATYNAPVTEYEMVLRLAEQYLIRAEAEANGAAGGLNAAVADLNVIRSRAGLPPYAGVVDKASVSSAILHERQIELFSEWGHRWFDLKRTGTVDAVMGSGGVTAAKGGTWKTTAQYYPVPLSELQTNPKLTQNPGY